MIIISLKNELILLIILNSKTHLLYFVIMSLECKALLELGLYTFDKTEVYFLNLKFVMGLQVLKMAELVKMASSGRT